MKGLFLVPVLLAASWCQPNPKPTPTPIPEPTVPSPICEIDQVCGCWHQPPGQDWQQLPPCPTPTPTPVPTPTPTPTPQPQTACPKTLAEGAYVYVTNKAYGQGFDAGVRVKGDKEFCRLIHGVEVNDCHLEGWPRRSACEMELMGGCPVWQYAVDKNGNGKQVCHDDQYAVASCDHFGDPVDRDDPKTPTTGDTVATLVGFEGRPLECGLQRDAFGPYAGFFTVAHGKGYIRACKPDGTECGSFKGFDH